MKNLVGAFVIAIAVVAIGWAGADEEKGVLEQIERVQLNAEKAEVQEAERREREPSNRQEQERQGDREKDEIVKRLAEAMQRRESLVKQFDDDHPEVREASRVIATLEKELEAIVRREESRHSEREQLKLHEKKLEELITLQQKLRQHLSPSHPSLKKTSKQIDALRSELETIERRRAEGHRHREESERKEIAQKIEHLHAAAGHLDHAGMPDMARELRKRAEDRERELHGNHAEPKELGRLLAELHEQMQDMKREIEKLRGEVGELRKQLASGDR